MPLMGGFSESLKIGCSFGSTVCLSSGVTGESSIDGGVTFAGISAVSRVGMK